jgi:HEAT repeat protein
VTAVRVRLRKKHAAFALVLTGGVALIAALCYALSPDVRAASVGVLERLGSDDTLASLAQDRDRNVQAAAADALVRRGAAAVPALVRRLGRPDAPDRVVAVRALGRIGPPARDAMPALRECARDDPAPFVRPQAALALALIGRGDPQAVAELVRLLGSAEEPDRVGAAFACRMLGADAKHAIPALVGALADPEPEVREEALKALTSITGRLGDEDAALRDRGAAAARKAMAEMAAGGPRPP